MKVNHLLNSLTSISCCDLVSTDFVNWQIQFYPVIQKWEHTIIRTLFEISKLNGPNSDLVSTRRRTREYCTLCWRNEITGTDLIPNITLSRMGEMLTPGVLVSTRSRKNEMNGTYSVLGSTLSIREMLASTNWMTGTNSIPVFILSRTSEMTGTNSVLVSTLSKMDGTYSVPVSTALWVGCVKWLTPSVFLLAFCVEWATWLAPKVFLLALWVRWVKLLVLKVFLLAVRVM